VQLPKLSLAMAEGTLSEWLVGDGEFVNEGQALYVVESDKVEVEVEAPGSGRVEHIAEAGQVYKVGERLGAIHAD
jgi:pyruvate dehydrogenase E2 component (dihydrolipoamide acetyltransferase)